MEEQQRTLLKKRKLFSVERLALVSLLATIVVICIAFNTIFQGTGDENQRRRFTRDNGNLAAFEATGRNPQLEEKFEVSTNRKWYMKGKQFTEAERTITITAKPKEELNIDKVGVRFEGKDKKIELVKQEDGTYMITMLSDDMEASSYKMEVAAVDKGNKNKEYVSAVKEFNVSFPLYVSWTIDWEGLDVNRTYVQWMDQIANKHGIPMVQYFNPRIFVALGKGEQNYQVNYVLERQKKYGDEIGLHLHMWYDLVRAAGVTAKTQPQWNDYGNGRDVPFSEYNEAETRKILEWSKSQFTAHGLPVPKNFRAGGWFTDDDNMKALVAAGFTIESSGRDADARGIGSVRGNWNLGPNTRPYRPSKNGINLNDEPYYENTWEYPNNCGDSWAYTKESMIQCFKGNLGNGILDWPQMVTYLTHPHWMYVDKPKMEAVFNESSKHLYKNDAGPVIYSTQEDTIGVWDEYGNRQ